MSRPVGELMIAFGLLVSAAGMLAFATFAPFIYSYLEQVSGFSERFFKRVPYPYFLAGSVITSLICMVGAVGLIKAKRWGRITALSATLAVGIFALGIIVETHLHATKITSNLFKMVSLKAPNTLFQCVTIGLLVSEIAVIFAAVVLSVRYLWRKSYYSEM